MEQYIDYSMTNEIPTILGTVFVCAWCSRVKKPGSDPKSPKSWKVVATDRDIQPGIFLSHGICPSCKAKIAA